MQEEQVRRQAAIDEERCRQKRQARLYESLRKLRQFEDDQLRQQEEELRRAEEQRRLDDQKFYEQQHFANPPFINCAARATYASLLPPIRPLPSSQTAPVSASILLLEDIWTLNTTHDVYDYLAPIIDPLAITGISFRTTRRARRYAHVHLQHEFDVRDVLTVISITGTRGGGEAPRVKLAPRCLYIRDFSPRLNKQGVIDFLFLAGIVPASIIYQEGWTHAYIEYLSVEEAAAALHHIDETMPNLFVGWANPS